MGYGQGGGNGRGGTRGGGRRQEYDNELRGVLFQNKKKRTDKDPGWQGQCTVNGVEYWVSAWVNENPDGSKRINFNLTEKEDESPQQRNQRRAAPRGRNDDDDFDRDDRQRGQQRNVARRDPGDDRPGYRAPRDEMDDDLDDVPF